MALTHNPGAELPGIEPVGIETTGTRTQRVLDAKVTRKVVTTILLGGLAYFITNQWSNYDEIWVITLSVFIGGVALVVQYMVDFERRLEDLEEKQAAHSSAIRSQIQDAFARMSKSTELFRAVEEPDPQTAEAMLLLRHAGRIAPCSAPLVSSFARSQIKQTNQLLKGLSEGRSVFYDGEDRDWMLGLTMQTQSTIDATSLSTVDAGINSFNGGLWTGDLGQRYLELQRLAVKERGVKIRRVFIILKDHGQASDEAFQRIYLQHKEKGIQTRVLEESQISGEFQPSLLDFVVFDGVVSYEVTPAVVNNAAKPSIVKTQLNLNPEEVMGRKERFERLWESARDIS